MSETRNNLPLVVHVIYRLDVGGLENGLVNLINHMPRRYRHAIVCLTVDTDFRKRINVDGVEIYRLRKREGKDPRAYWRLWRLLRRLQPRIVHTRNIATLDQQFVACLARVPCRVHGEHGWDLFDLHGQRPRYRHLRRLSQSVVHRYVTVSQHMQRWLTGSVGIDAAAVSCICNGVDTAKFRPYAGGRRLLVQSGFAREDDFVIGTVGRLEAVKNQAMLLDAFAEARRVHTGSRELKLAVVGNGSEYAALQAQVRGAGLEHCVWMPGARDDVAQILQSLDLFVLTSRNEGISNTILEAMASGLPVVATDVGGNAELVINGKTGKLVASDDVTELATAMVAYASKPAERQAHAAAARDAAEHDYSIARMVGDYAQLYDRLLTSEKFTRGHLSCAE